MTSDETMSVYATFCHQFSYLTNSAPPGHVLVKVNCNCNVFFFFCRTSSQLLARGGEMQRAVDIIKVVILGATGSGKSALLFQLVTDRFMEDYDATSAIPVHAFVILSARS